MTSREYSASTMILGGLPCIINGYLSGPEPDVGIMCDYVHDHWLTFNSGHVMGDNITNRISYDEWGRLDDELMAAAKNL
jgi:hypothetical protein